MKYTTITYIGKTPGYIVKMGKKTYDFEWQKGLAIGKRNGEIFPEHVNKIAKWRDKRGKKIFFLE
jgi:hypothetical protein